MSTHRIPLDGCRSAPLGSYLQGLGAWSAVVRLADDGATAGWQGGRLVLHTALDREQLVSTFVDSFQPLPLVSPWNKGSGFAGNGKSKAAEELLARVAGSTDARLRALRDGVEAAWRVVEQGQARDWGGTGDDLWTADRKADVVLLCRNLLPEASLAWLDAAVVLTQDGRGDPGLAFNRLLGTGGNFGRQDLQTSYLDRMFTVLDGGKKARGSAGWLRGALFGEEGTPYLRESVGQFDPGRAGGMQSSPAEKSDDKGFANPWSSLLTIEGALLFAAAAVRRQGSRTVGASMPFLVRASGVGHPSAALDEAASAEVWTPEWDRPATLPEVRHLLGEGRAEWRGDPARSGLDFARAIAAVGVDRGLTRFTRSVVVERLGQNPLAVPVGVVDVPRRPRPDLTGGLDDWLARVNRGEVVPTAIRRAVRQVQEAQYALATGAGPGSARMLLSSVGRLHGLVARSGSVRARVRPLRLDQAAGWVEQLDLAGPDAAPWRLAAALASGRDRETAAVPPLRGLLEPVTTDSGRLAWSQRAARAPLAAGVVAALAEAHRRRLLAGAVRDPRLPTGATSESATDRDWPEPAVAGPYGAFERAWRAPLADVVALAAGRIDEAAVTTALAGFLLVHGPDRRTWTDPLVGSSAEPVVVPPALALLAPFFGVRPLRVRFRDTDPDDARVLLRPGPTWLPLLTADRVADVCTDARRRLFASGARGVIDPDVAALGADGHHLAAALLVPLRDGDRARCLRATCLTFDAAQASAPAPRPESDQLREGTSA